MVGVLLSLLFLASGYPQAGEHVYLLWSLWVCSLKLDQALLLKLTFFSPTEAFGKDPQHL